jgi:ABC-type sulfate transport system substrate-binding protein
MKHAAMFVKTIKKTLLLIAVTAVSLQAAAQDLETDMQAIIEKVAAAETYEITTSVKVYSKKGGTQIHQMKASVAASKTAVLTIIGEIEMLTTENQIITVDRQEKLIEVQDAAKNQGGKSPRKAKNAINLEDLEKLAGDDSGLVFKLTSTSGNVRTYTASNTKAGIRSIVLKIDFVEKKLISYTTEMSDEQGNAGQYIVVDYTQFSYSLDNPESIKPSRFITGSENALQPSATYKGYTLIQQ